MIAAYDIRSRLKTALIDGHSLDLSGEMSDERDMVETETLTGAAVLIAITDRPAPGVILVQRPDYMRNHPGQIAFPGGKIDPEDTDANAAALREANEEVALDPARVDLIGHTDPYHSGSGYHIQPVLAVIPPDLPLVPCPEEVEDWFEVPLDYVLDPANAVRHSGTWRGQTRHYYEIMWQERRIWGITAGILVNLSKRLRWTI